MRHAHFAIDHKTDNQHQSNRYSTGFCRREDVKANTANDCKQKHDSRPGRGKCRCNFGTAHSLLATWLVATLHGGDISSKHQDDGTENTRNDTRHEHLADGNVRNQAVDDQRNARRNDRSDKRTSCCDRT
ncbi:hypothetical protein D3C80_500690 [compost metagenome]